MSKICTKCKKKKSLGEFSIDKRHRDGKASSCKECDKTYKKQYYKDNKERYLKNQRKRNLKIKFNLTADDYNRMFEEQQGCCAICGTHQNEFDRKLSVDHDHSNGKIRGLLCTWCNVRLPHVEDIEFVIKAKKYLSQFDVIDAEFVETDNERI
jgi:hypothetical protein